MVTEKKNDQTCKTMLNKQKKKPSIRCLPTASNKSVYTVSSATI